MLAPGWDQIWPWGHYLNNLGSGLLNDATCQVYKPSMERMSVLRQDHVMNLSKLVQSSIRYVAGNCLLNGNQQAGHTRPPFHKENTT